MTDPETAVLNCRHQLHIKHVLSANCKIPSLSPNRRKAIQCIAFPGAFAVHDIVGCRMNPASIKMVATFLNAT